MEWGLTMTQRETEAVIVMLDTCEEPVDVKAKRAEGIAGTDTSGQAVGRGGNGNTNISAGAGSRRDHPRV